MLRTVTHYDLLDHQSGLYGFINRNAMNKYNTAPRVWRVRSGVCQNQLVPPLKCEPATNHANAKSTEDSATIAILVGNLITFEFRLKVMYIGKLIIRTNKVNPAVIPRFSMKARANKLASS